MDNNTIEWSWLDIVGVGLILAIILGMVLAGKANLKPFHAPSAPKASWVA